MIVIQISNCYLQLSSLIRGDSTSVSQWSFTDGARNWLTQEVRSRCHAGLAGIIGEQVSSIPLGRGRASGVLKDTDRVASEAGYREFRSSVTCPQAGLANHPSVRSPPTIKSSNSKTTPKL